MSIKKIVNLYTSRGFTVDTALMDREFECLRSDLPDINLNTTAASEHVPDVERQIRFIKERSRAIRSTLPFKALPGRIIIELVYYATLWLNAFPPSSGVSDTYSPRTIMTGTTLDFAKHCKLPFGAYAEAHEEYPQTNTMTEGTRAVICLGPTGNFQGSYKMMCITTGRKVTCKQFKELPMPDSVVKRIEAISSKEKQDKVLVFTDRHTNPIGDDDDTAGVDIPTDNDDDNNDNNNTSNNPPGILHDEPADETSDHHDNDDDDSGSAGVLHSESTGVLENVEHYESTRVPDDVVTEVTNNENETAENEDETA
jgi:hypothetical protein